MTWLTAGSQWQRKRVEGFEYILNKNLLFWPSEHSHSVGKTDVQANPVIFQHSYFHEDTEGTEKLRMEHTRLPRGAKVLPAVSELGSKNKCLLRERTGGGASGRGGGACDGLEHVPGRPPMTGPFADH